jgi:hypothetical protein
MKKLTLALIPLVFCFAAGSEATVIVTFADLLGSNEAPPNASPGTGQAVVTYNSVTHILTVDVNFTGLLAPTTVAHIHCCTDLPRDITDTAGVATTTPSFPGFPTGVTAGSYSSDFDLTLASSWNPSFVTASGGIAQAEARLADALREGTSYFNIHTSQFGAGEIRGFLVPEPAMLSLLGIGLAAIAARRKRR